MTRLKYVIAACALLPAPVLASIDDECSKEPNNCIMIADRISPELIVVTATGAEQRISWTGQAISVLNQTTIQSRQLPSVADLLATTPGITTSRNGGPGQTTAVRIRGAEDAQTLVLIDGVRVNDPSSPGGSFDFGNLLTGNIERIEVLRGPNSVPWGSQAIGGVVNIVTATPPADFEGRLSGEYGDTNSARLVGRIGGSIGPVAASIGGGYFRDDGVSAYKFGTERDGFRQYAANARAVVTLSNAVNVDLRGYYADGRVSFDGFAPPLFSFADTADYSKTKQVFGYAGINATIGALKNRLAYSIGDTQRQSFSAFPFTAKGRVERFEYQGDASLGDAIRAVFGIEHENSRFIDGTNRYTTGLTSGYLQAIVNPTDTLTLTGGVRVDDHRAYGTKTTLSANAAWRPARGTVIRASYGEGFKAPALAQLNGFYGNDQLKPETAQSFDIGIEQALVGDALKVGVTAFHRDTRQQIDFTFTAARPFGVYANIARTRAEGVEATVELRPTTTLIFAANYTLTDSKNRDTGETLLRRPKHSVNASIDWSGPHNLRLGASIQTVSDARDFDFVTFDPASLDGYTLASLRASLPIGDHLEIYGRIENLFDAKYETVSGYGTYGRNAHVGARLSF